MTLRTDSELSDASKANSRPYYLLSIAAVLVCILAVKTGCDSLGVSDKEAQIDSNIYIVVDEMPRLVGGLKAVASQIKYPDIARKAGVEGKVFVSLVVDEQGNVSDAQVSRGLGAGLDEEALRVVGQAKFTPGRQRGNAVKVRMTLPIQYKLGGSSTAAGASDGGAGNAAPPQFVVIESVPEIIGGLKALTNQIEYPEIARKAGLEGRVFVSFFVDEQGNVESPEVVRGIGGGCDEEALRVVRLVKFTPGQQKGESVRTRLTIPIQFKLD